MSPFFEDGLRFGGVLLQSLPHPLVSFAATEHSAIHLTHSYRGSTFLFSFNKSQLEKGGRIYICTYMIVLRMISGRGDFTVCSVVFNDG